MRGASGEREQCDARNEDDFALAHVDSPPQEAPSLALPEGEQGNNAGQRRSERRTVSPARCCAPRLETSEARLVRIRSRSRPFPDAVTRSGLRRRDRSAANAGRTTQG